MRVRAENKLEPLQGLSPIRSHPMSVTTSCSDLRDRIMVESESQTTGTLGNNKIKIKNLFSDSEDSIF